MFGSEKVRGIVWQVLLLVVVVASGWYLFSNTQANLARSNIQVGFDFLHKEAGFEIAESLIPYDATRTYGRAFLVGIGNTLYVSVIGIVLATLLGTIVGIARLSQNWLVRKLASAYVEVMRNIPLLLQLLSAIPSRKAVMKDTNGCHLERSTTCQFRTQTCRHDLATSCTPFHAFAE